MSQVFFKCGFIEITTGVLELDLTGLGIPFIPAVVQVSVASPSTEADLISAYVVGASTADGFTVQFSSTIPAAGYILNWTAWAGDVSHVDTGTLALDYSDFFASVKRFLGWQNTVTLSADQTAEVDEYVQSGVRQFYYPPAMAGVDVQHEWSFLRPVGQVTTADGVSTILLPDGFGRLIGNLEFAPELYIPAAISVSEGLVRERLATRPQDGPPKFVCARRIDSYDGNGQQCQLLMWPTPDAAYVLTFQQESDSGKLSETLRPFPLGGSRFSELILESCLSMAEQRANDEEGLHTRKFQALLASAVMQDRKFSAVFYGPMSASSLGNASSSDFLGGLHNRQEVFPITYKGATW